MNGSLEDVVRKTRSAVFYILLTVLTVKRTEDVVQSTFFTNSFLQQKTCHKIKEDRGKRFNLKLNVFQLPTIQWPYNLIAFNEVLKK